MLHTYLTGAGLKNIFHTHLSDSAGRRPRTGSTGVDGVSLAAFRETLPESAELIARKLSNGTYDFSLYREKLVPKGRSAAPRVISIPTNRDKLVLKALHLILSEHYSEVVRERSIHGMVADIRKRIGDGSCDSFLRLDIKDFFPSIRHDLLLETLGRTVPDEWAHSLVRKAISQTTVAATERNREKYQNSRGVPQGLPISNLLASIFLLDFDRTHAENTESRYFRFVDDILVLCREKDREHIHRAISSDLEQMGLSVHDASAGSAKSAHGRIAEGFQYLGYLFDDRLVSVRPSSLDKIYRGINRVFTQHCKYAPQKNLDRLYYQLNLKITGCFVGRRQFGWLHFFSQISDEELLFKLDAHVKRSCRRFGVPYDPKRIKTFSRTYYELIKAGGSRYIPKYLDYTGRTIADVEELLSPGNDKNGNAGRPATIPGWTANNAPGPGPALIDPRVVADIEADIDYY